jgi:hypothetical protein
MKLGRGLAQGLQFPESIKLAPKNLQLYAELFKLYLEKRDELTETERMIYVRYFDYISKPSLGYVIPKTNT